MVETTLRGFSITSFSSVLTGLHRRTGTGHHTGTVNHLFLHSSTPLTEVVTPVDVVPPVAYGSSVSRFDDL